jgi:hypothetical protein
MSEEAKIPHENQAGAKDFLDYFSWQIPVGLLLVTFLVTNFLQLGALFEQKKALETNRAQAEQLLPRAQLVRDKLDSLARDIVALVPTNSNAKLIQEELKIQIAENSQLSSTAPLTPPKKP